jgi:multidrug efflux pump subunit AcrA (membrane-fusion protein)
LMGFDNKSEDFHQSLLKLIEDPEPIVRRNAALALVRFNDPAGRHDLLGVLAPYEIKANADGVVASVLQDGSEVVRGTLVGRINQSGGTIVEVRSPLPGRIERIFTHGGSSVSTGATLLTVISDEDSVWEALRGLAFIGQAEDLPIIERYAQAPAQPERIRKQAAATANAIKQRASQTENVR